MRTVRRLYFLVTFISLEAMLWGLIQLVAPTPKLSGHIRDKSARQGFIAGPGWAAGVLAALVKSPERRPKRGREQTSSFGPSFYTGCDWLH